jgi:hypothetical protein
MIIINLIKFFGMVVFAATVVLGAVCQVTPSLSDWIEKRYHGFRKSNNGRFTRFCLFALFLVIGLSALLNAADMWKSVSAQAPTKLDTSTLGKRLVEFGESAKRTNGTNFLKIYGAEDWNKFENRFGGQIRETRQFLDRSGISIDKIQELEDEAFDINKVTAQSIINLGQEFERAAKSL